MPETTAANRSNPAQAVRLDVMTLRGGVRAALITGPDGHRFLAEEAARAGRTVVPSHGNHREARSDEH